MRIALTTLNSKYIHKNLALRWIYAARDPIHTTRIFEFVMKDDLNKCTQMLQEYAPDVIGISVYIWNANRVKIWIQLIKAALPHCKIILGGPEVSYEYEEWFKIDIDGIIRGEGEKTFWLVVNGKEEVEGLITRDYCSPIPFAHCDITWLETLPSPYFLPMDAKDMKQRYLYLETSRGCPYQCSYCLSSTDNQVRLFSLEYIEKQLSQLKNIEVKQVKFLDRTFNVHPKRAFSLAKIIKNLQIKTTFQLEIVAESLSKELLEYFQQKENNINYRFEVGVQSFNQEALRSVCRIQNNEKLSEIIRSMNEWGCVLHVDLIAGLPYEDMNSFERSFNQLFALKAQEMQVGILKLLKGTSLRKQAKKYGIVYQQEVPYKVIKTNWMSEADLLIVEDVYHACEKFYNSGKCRRTMDILISQNKFNSAFDLMKQLGRGLAKLPAPYQIMDLFLLFYQTFQNQINNDELKGLLLVDYYALFKQRPKRLFTERIDDIKKKSIFAWLIDLHQFDEQTLYNYANIEYGYSHGKQIYQCLVYDKFQNRPKRYWIDLEQNKMGCLEEDK